MSAHQASNYDPNVIIKAAEDKVATNDMAGAQMVYRSALLDWGDDTREGIGLDLEQMREAIATLWLAYADLNRNAKMYKSATEAYEQAVSDPVARCVGRIWLDYARFAEERGKLRTAQNVYLRALVGDKNSAPAVTDEQDQELLWTEFLEMMRKSNSSLTLDELKHAVKQEHLETDSMMDVADGNPEQVMSMLDDDGDENRPEKRQKVMGDSPVTAPTESKSYVVTPEAVEAEKADILSATQAMPPELTGAWLARDGASAPTCPEPPLFSASPPKLADPTGKGILGEDLALALITRLLKKDDSDKSGTILLEVSRGCWLLAALKEKEAAKAIDNLDTKMTSEMEALQANLDARLSVAGSALSAIQQMNDNERNAFIDSCNHRRRQLLGMIAWDFRQLLCVQQQIFTKIQVPGFEGPTVDAASLDLQSRICSFLHSAFFLRSRIGEAPHLAMLKSQMERLSNKKGKSQPSPPPAPPLSHLPPPPLPIMFDGIMPPPYPPPPAGQPILPQQVPGRHGVPMGRAQGVAPPPFLPPPLMPPGGGKPPGNHPFGQQQQGHFY